MKIPHSPHQKNKGIAKSDESLAFEPWIPREGLVQPTWMQILFEFNNHKMK